MNLIFKIGCCTLISLSAISNVNAYASDNFALNRQVNDSLKLLNESLGKIQSINGDDILIKFGNIKEANPDKSSLKAMGEAVKFPTSLKSELDESERKVIEGLDSMMTSNRNASSNPSCESQLTQIEQQFQQIKTEVEKSWGLNVAEPESRAKAYINALSAMPLSIIAGKISMLNMTACRAK